MPSVPASRDPEQISRGKFNRLPCTAAESTLCVLDGNGLRDHRPARPIPLCGTSYPVFVHRLASRLAGLRASFGPRLATIPLCGTSLTLHPARRDWVEDFHLQAVEHARHTGWRRHRFGGVKKFENGRLWMPQTVENAGAAIGHFQFFHTFFVTSATC